MDVMLPYENGDEITKKLKTNNKYKDIPVVLMSASQDLEDKALNARANHYLPKPFDNQKLISVVDDFCMDI